jgi:hypothetical protein
MRNGGTERAKAWSCSCTRPRAPTALSPRFVSDGHMHQRAEGQGPTLQSLLSGVALLLLPASRWASLSAETLRGRGGSSR